MEDFPDVDAVLGVQPLLVPATAQHIYSTGTAQAQHGHRTVTAQSQHAHNHSHSTVAARAQHSHRRLVPGVVLGQLLRRPLQHRARHRGAVDALNRRKQTEGGAGNESCTAWDRSCEGAVVSHGSRKDGRKEATGQGRLSHGWKEGTVQSGGKCTKLILRPRAKIKVKVAHERTGGREEGR